MRSVGLAVLLAACGGKTSLGGVCKSTSDCSAGLHCGQSSKKCEPDASSTGSTTTGGTTGSSAPTAPTISVAASSTAPYIGMNVALTATVTPSDATVTWSVLKPDATTETLTAGATTSFVPAAVGAYTVTATATASALTATAATTLTAKAATVGAYIAFDKLVDGESYGYYSFASDLSSFRRMDTPGEGSSFVPVASNKFAYAFLAPDISGYELHIGPNTTTPSTKFGAWEKFTTDTCAYGTAGPAPTHAGGGSDCYQTVFGLESSGDGRTLSFLVGRSPTLDLDYAGDLWVADTTQTVPSAALVVLTDVGNTITAASPSADGQQIAVVQASPDNILNGLGLIANRASPTITTGSFANKISYTRPKPLPGGDILAVRHLGPTTTPPNDSSPIYALVRATTPYEVTNQTVVFGAQASTSYQELVRNTAGPTDEEICNTNKAGGGLGVSTTDRLDYALSSDHRYAAVWQNALLYNDCSNLVTPSGRARRVVVIDLQTSSATTLSLHDAGVEEIGAGGSTDSRGILRAQFIAEDQQVLISLTQNALGNSDERVDLYIVNRDGTHPRRLLTSGTPVVAAGNAVGIVSFR